MEEKYKEYDNIFIKDLPIILNRDTTLERFYPLVGIRDFIVEALLEKRIIDKYVFLSRNLELLAYDTKIELDKLVLLSSFFNLYKFKPVKLVDIQGFNKDFIAKLKPFEVENSFDFMQFFQKYRLYWIHKKFDVSINEIIKMFSLCNLMRLPGVKNIRANLYWKCGYSSLEIISKEGANVMQKYLSSIIEDKKYPESVPLLKELKTQIAYAKVFANDNLK